MSKIMYKLVSQSYQSHNKMLWEIGKTNEATTPGNTMCTNQVLHCYSSPHQAVIFNRVHADIKNPILLEIEVDEIVNTDGCKFASKKQTPLRVIELPVLSTEQRIAIAIKCSLLKPVSTAYKVWAENWLSGADRTKKSAAYVYAAAAAGAADAAAADAAYADAAAAAAAADVYAAAGAAYAYAAAAAAAAYANKNQFNQTLESIIQEVLAQFL